MKTVLLIGCGDIACRFARQLQEQQLEARDAQHPDYKLWGLKRSLPADFPDNIEIIQADLLKPETLQPLSEQTFDYAIATLSPSQFNEQAYREIYVQGLKNVLQVLNLRQRFFWVSSTSVYGQLTGEWVDELSETRPSAFSGRIQLEAEQVIKSSGLPYTIIRFAGIYGPGRNRLIERVKGGKLDAGENWSNRIHIDDCAGILLHLLQLADQQGSLSDIYLGVDDLPCQLKDVYQFLAEKSGIDIELSGESKSSRAGSKRCSNRRLKQTGYQFIHPTFKSGYQAFLVK